MILKEYLYQVGFEMIDQIAQAEGVLLNTIQSKALIGIGCYAEYSLLISVSLWRFSFLSFFLPFIRA